MNENGTSRGGSEGERLGTPPPSPGRSTHDRARHGSSLLGERLGIYEVQEQIGAGGMGEVYRAQDSRLKRTVALKVLPAECCLDAERLSRLEREARLLAALNHPNIAAIHGLEEAKGTRFLVLEMVEGQTLAERLKWGPMPLRETAELGRQLAEGLEAAHDKGIVHRDLKPANIKLTPGGVLKILDFGLAKVPTSSVSDPEASTLTQDLSRPGMILGTPAYMSPEQATGKPIDHRTDVWAYGCILYECLTGKKAFRGGTTTETLAAVLAKDPDWDALPQTIPSRMRLLLQRCLQKEPRQRLHDVGDARLELCEPAFAVPEESPRLIPRLSSLSVVASAFAILGVGLLLGILGSKYLRHTSTRPPQPVSRLVVKVEPGTSLDSLCNGPPYGRGHPTRTSMAISNGGRFLVFCAAEESPGGDKQPWLYVRRFDQLEAKRIPGTERGLGPVLSPDDRWILYWADYKLMKVAVEGGVPVELCACARPFGLSWSANNQIVFSHGDGSGLLRVSAAGGKPEELTSVDRSKGEYAHRLPCCLPGGKGVVFSIFQHAWDPQPRLAVLDLATKNRRVLMENATDPRFVSPGDLIFLRQSILMVVPFDTERLKLSGEPVPVLTGVSQALNTRNSNYETAAGQFSVSASGTLVYAPGTPLPPMANSLVWVDHEGNAEPVTPQKGEYFAPRLSPDGQRIVYRDNQLRMLDLDRGTVSLLADVTTSFSAWCPDGKRVAFGLRAANASALCNIYWQPVDGSSPAERLTEGDRIQFPGSWSPDGRTLAFVEHHDQGGAILTLSLPDRRVTPYRSSGSSQTYPEFSPDGQWLAYVSDESSAQGVYVESFPPGKNKWQVSGPSSPGATQPIWARDGKTLFYRSEKADDPDREQIWAVDIQTSPPVSIGKPRLLFELFGYSGGNPIRGWDISLDGKRFLMVKLEERKAQPATEMVVVQNWLQEVRRVVPAGK